MMIQTTGKRSVNCLMAKPVVMILGLALSVPGCYLGTFVPSHSLVELDDQNPLKGSISNVRSLAVLTTATSGGLDTTGMTNEALTSGLVRGGQWSIQS